MTASTSEQSYPALFMRGGTSKALMFRREDLPARGEWDAIFCGAMGSPDAYGRQLNGMGGGLSSLSKVCVIGPSNRSDADVDYTFGQVLIDERRVDYHSNCGNMSAAVGPFAIEAGLVNSRGDTAVVRIFNTNTGKVIHAIFPVDAGKVTYDGGLEIPGVSGTGAAIQLQFLDPGGASTGRLLPSGRASDAITVGDGRFVVSMIDAANACVFVGAEDVGLHGAEMPERLERDADVLALLASIRAHASVRMGIAPDLEHAGKIGAAPSIAVVGAPRDYHSLGGALVTASNHDLSIRVISNGQPHRAAPLTIALCSAVACRIEGSIPAGIVMNAVGESLRLGTPSGVLTVGADVRRDAAGEWRAETGTFLRTARKLFEGRVWSSS